MTDTRGGTQALLEEPRHDGSTPGGGDVGASRSCIMFIVYRTGGKRGADGDEDGVMIILNLLF